MINSLNINNQFLLTTSIAKFASYGIYSALVVIITLILIFVLKLGFPLACVGLVNADGGVFKSYIEKMLKSVLTVIIQIMLCKLALALIFSVQFINAIVIIVAIKTYKLLPEFVLGGGSVE